MRRPIYLDYMATTPVDPRVLASMLPYLGPEGEFGNPASIHHVYGQQAAMAVDRARSQIADAVGANLEEIVFTSGATVANNLASLGAARFYQRKGRHVVTMTT
jgi:cysteine desulfurase